MVSWFLKCETFLQKLENFNFTYEVFRLLFLTVSHLYWNNQHRQLSLVKVGLSSIKSARTTFLYAAVHTYHHTADTNAYWYADLQRAFWII